GVGGTTDAGQSIIQTSDSGYAVAGYTDGISYPYNDFYIVKLDASGIPCSEYNSGSDWLTDGLFGAGGTSSSGGIAANINLITGSGGTAATICSSNITCSASGTVSANVSCNGGCNGSAYITPSNGTPPYTYS